MRSDVLGCHGLNARKQAAEEFFRLLWNLFYLYYPTKDLNTGSHKRVTETCRMQKNIPGPSGDLILHYKQSRHAPNQSVIYHEYLVSEEKTTSW